MQQIAIQKTEKIPKEFQKHFSRLWHCLTAPIVVPPQYVNDEIGEDIKTRITIERFINILNPENFLEEGTDTEAMLYISKISFMHPLGDDWYRIYMYLSRKFFEKLKIEIPDFLNDDRFKDLEDGFQKHYLKHLKEWIYKKQKEHIKKKSKIKGYEVD